MYAFTTGTCLHPSQIHQHRHGKYAHRRLSANHLLLSSIRDGGLQGVTFQPKNQPHREPRLYMRNETWLKLSTSHRKTTSHSLFALAFLARHVHYSNPASAEYARNGDRYPKDIARRLGMKMTEDRRSIGRRGGVSKARRNGRVSGVSTGDGGRLGRLRLS
jgi:hypothetical protein